MIRTFWTFETIGGGFYSQHDRGNVMFVYSCNDAQRRKCGRKKRCLGLREAKNTLFGQCRKISIEVKEIK